MQRRFSKHYTREEAQALLPEVRIWLERLSAERSRMGRLEKQINQWLGDGRDVGGKSVNDWIRAIAGLRRVLLEFQRREIQLKDLERGLVDFPSIIGGREVFLCWEQDEEEIEHWHDLESGYAGRERLE